MKLLILILEAHSDRDVTAALSALPAAFKNDSRTEILFIYETWSGQPAAAPIRNVRFFKASTGRGRGGDQKIGFTYAQREGFDVVAVFDAAQPAVLSDLPQLIEPFRAVSATDCVLGVPRNRSLNHRLLTALKNRLCGVQLSDWQNPCRAYSVRGLSGTGFALNTNDAHFDTEILLQLISAGAKTVEVRTSGRVVNHNDTGALKAAIKFKLQKWHLFYDVRFHPEIVLAEPPQGRPTVYQEKINSRSPHSILFETGDKVPMGSRVLDVGSASGYVAEELYRRRNCQVTAVDVLDKANVNAPHIRYEQINLETETPTLVRLVQEGAFDVILMLDVLEHTAMPEKILLQLSTLPYEKPPKFICSTANVAFFVVRFMLVFGHFNYGQKGILDITHKRLFSLHTFRNLLEQTGFVVQKEEYFPFPFRELGFTGFWARMLEGFNLFLIRLRPRLFSYQIMLEAYPLATPAQALKATAESAPRPAGQA